MSASFVAAVSARWTTVLRRANAPRAPPRFITDGLATLTLADGVVLLTDLPLDALGLVL